MTARGILAGALMALAAQPALAQGQPGRSPDRSLDRERQEACRDEANRLTETFLGNQTLAGTRRGSSLDSDTRTKLRGLLDEVRTAADHGDTEGCLNRLRDARNLARQGGVGSFGSTLSPANPRGGGSSSPQSGSGRSGSGTGSGGGAGGGGGGGGGG